MSEKRSRPPLVSYLRPRTPPMLCCDTCKRPLSIRENIVIVTEHYSVGGHAMPVMRVYCPRCAP